MKMRCNKSREKKNTRSKRKRPRLCNSWLKSIGLTGFPASSDLMPTSTPHHIEWRYLSFFELGKRHCHHHRYAVERLCKRIQTPTPSPLSLALSPSIPPCTCLMKQQREALAKKKRGAKKMKKEYKFETHDTIPEATPKLVQIIIFKKKLRDVASLPYGVGPPFASGMMCSKQPHGYPATEPRAHIITPQTSAPQAVHWYRSGWPHEAQFGGAGAAGPRSSSCCPVRRARTKSRSCSSYFFSSGFDVSVIRMVQLPRAIKSVQK